MAHKQPRRKGERYRDTRSGRFVADHEGQWREHAAPASVRRSRVRKPRT